MESLRRSFPPFALDLDALWRSFLVRRDYFLTRAEKRVQGVFADLYENRISITNDYLRLKIMDLLIALEAIVSANCQAEKPYFKRSHVEKVRQVRDYLCENLSHRPTAERLARQFELPQATLRQCFSAMYGLSIPRFMQECSRRHAATLLERSDLSVLDIALTVGYENPSKFWLPLSGPSTQRPSNIEKTMTKRSISNPSRSGKAPAFLYTGMGAGRPKIKLEKDCIP